MEESLISEIKDRINFFLQAFGIAGEVIVKESDGTIIANIATGRPEILIGRGGQTLLALQQIVRAMVSKNLGEDDVLVVDVENYRQKHNDRVKMQAREAALKVLASGEPVAMSPMSSFERRLVHIAMTDFADLEADSEGYGLGRHIIIKPKAQNSKL